jgi:phosphopantothenoylcysteine decarboxylase/phosphopantothenate--cysteine ligase
LANDLATTALLATDKPVMVAPAMNVRMWQHPATQRNIAQLKSDGIQFVGPNDGDMACGEFGPGRLSEPVEILTAVEGFFGISPKPLAGKKIIITSGPTHEPIDPVRYIANRSSGKQGTAIAVSLVALGANVVLVSGPTNQPGPAGVTMVKVESARDMLTACQAALPANALICAAAVADYRTDGTADQKLKKTVGGIPTLNLVENPDILATLSKSSNNRPELVIGFAAETQTVIEFAQAKRKRKGCDWVIANDVSSAKGVMGGDDNTVHLITSDNVEDWPTMTKVEVANQLAARIATYFAAPMGANK